MCVLLRRRRRRGDLARLAPVPQDQDHDQRDDAEEVAQNSEKDRVIALAVGDLRAGYCEHKRQRKDENDEEGFDDSNLPSPRSASNVLEIVTT